LGKVRSERVKKAARELIEKYPGKFTDDFGNNKKIIDGFTEISSKRLRNRLAGYVTRLVSINKTLEEAEVAEPKETE